MTTLLLAFALFVSEPTDSFQRNGQWWYCYQPREDNPRNFYPVKRSTSAFFGQLKTGYIFIPPVKAKSEIWSWKASIPENKAPTDTIVVYLEIKKRKYQVWIQNKIYRENLRRKTMHLYFDGKYIFDPERGRRIAKYKAI